MRGGFTLSPIEEDSLAEVASYFSQWRLSQAADSDNAQSRISEEHRIEDITYLRWLLVENPARGDDRQLGICARDQNGALSGVMLTVPSYFVWGDKRLKGLCSSSFFVKAEARTQGFFIFKRYLNSKGPNFFYATTCGSASAALWSKLRGRPVPNSESTLVIPYRMESLLESFAENRNFHPTLVALLRVAGKIGSAFSGTAVRSSQGLRVAPCRDWEKLADLASIHRNPACITNERSANFLEWRYGKNQAGDLKELYRFWDHRGREGWFAIGSSLTGGKKKFSATELLDFVWPREQVDVSELISAVVAQTYATSDALYIRQRLAVRLGGLGRAVIRRRLPSPRCYVSMANGSGTCNASLFDFVAADGDSSP